MRFLSKAVLAGVLTCMSLAAQAANSAAVNSHYVVVRVDAQGHIEPVSYQAVELKSPPKRTTSAALKRAAVDPQQLLAYAPGWSEVVEAPRKVRGEFAANGVSGRIRSHVVTTPASYFVLRVPASAGPRVELKHRGVTSVLDLERVAREVPPFRGRATTLNTKTSVKAGNPANRVDVLIVGEGYTSAEQSKFNADVTAFTTRMFGFTPYKEYKSYLNVVPLFVPSSQSGADHPAYQSGCTTSSCCADAEAQNDPRSGTFVNTAFDGKFCTAQIHRLITVDDGKVFTAAGAAYPDWDEIMVIVNDPVYGGAGGATAVFTTHSAAGDVAIHEFGHSFTKLADEYESAYPGFPACSDIAGAAACEANVTNQTSPALIKWNSWITPGTAIPTPSGTPGTGLFQGARYQTTGMYRPAHTCAMRELSVPFCAVCSQEYILKLYANVRPIDSYSPVSANAITIPLGLPRVFSVNVLRPAPDTMRLQWYFNGQPIAGATGSSYTYVGKTTGYHQLEVRVSDASTLVKPVMAGTRLQQTRSWTIDSVGSARNDFDGDGRSDLFWRNFANGSNDIWPHANESFGPAVPPVTNMAWQVVGAGDFNGDGKDDVLWRNATTGANDIWLSGVATTRLPIAAEYSSAWKVVGVGDFNGDSKADIFWRNSSTGANGVWWSANRSTSQSAQAVPDLNWQVVGVGDFNADGKDDILWRHATSGANDLWRSATASQRQALTSVTTIAWKVAGVADFNNDGRADILWRNTSSGANAWWPSGSAALVKNLATVADQNYRIVAVGNYDGYGNGGGARVLWRNVVTGNNEIWNISVTPHQRRAITPVSNLSWHVVL